MMDYQSMDFNVGVVRPVECLKEGWALIKDQYWLFLGIVFVGVFVGGAVPIVLIGPMMVGIYLCFFRRMRNETVEFGELFKGFDHFAQGLIVALLQMIPMVVVMVPMYVIFFVIFIAAMPSHGGRMDPSEGQALMLTFFAFYVVFILLIIAVAIAVSIFFIFAFPLVADRGLSGLDAVKTSMKAGKANFGGILGLLLLNAGLGILGVFACYVGVFFLMPIALASHAIAYRRVFPEIPRNLASPPPPPPANWAA